MSQLTRPTAGLAVFPLFAGAAVLRGSHRAEQPLFAKASAGEAVAQLWQAPQGLVVPGAIVSLRICRRSARILPRAGRYGFAAPAAVCPGPGIINLSLAAGAAAARRSRRTDLSFAVRGAAAYPRALRRCQPPRAVNGSFAMAGITSPAGRARRRARLSVPPSTGGR